MKKSEIIILILIILLAAFLRLFLLTSVPLSLHNDEALVGYEAWSILETGKDQYGVSFPLHFKTFGDYIPGLCYYATVPFVAVFGLTEFAVRFPSALFGIATVYFIFLLAKELFNNTKLSLLAAFLAACSPWLIHFSRLAFPAALLTLLLCAGLYLVVRGMRQGNYLSVLGAFLLALTIFTYPPAKVFTPLLCIALAVIYRKELRKHWQILLGSVFVVLLVVGPIFYDTLTHYSEYQARFVSMSVFADGVSMQNLEILGENYLAHFSPDYLFINGDSNLRHHFLFGMLYPFEIITVALGLIYLAINFKKKFTWLLGVWLALWPLASALTTDGVPHSIRSVMGAPLLAIISAAGLWWAWEKIKRIKYLNFIGGFCTGLLTIILIVVWSYSYFTVYPYLSANYFRYGYPELFWELEKLENDYNNIVLEKVWHQPYMLKIFYGQMDPEEFQNSGAVRGEMENGLVPLRELGQYRFVETIDKNNLQEGNLYVFSGAVTDLPAILTIDYPFGSSAFTLVEGENND